MIFSQRQRTTVFTFTQTVGLFLLCFISFVASAEISKEQALVRADALQERLDNMMQNSASWLDNIGNEEGEGASANGYLQLSWIPRTADVADVDAKFKVYLNLPQWSDRLSLIIDNDDDDELILDYASDYLKQEDDGVNVAIQYVKNFRNNRKVKNKIGVSRSQLYLRSELQYQWQKDNITLNIKPRIDYFLQDGWGPGVKGILRYQLANSQISLSSSWQKIQVESKSRLKFGAYHIISVGEKQLLVSGARYSKSINKENISNQVYNTSVRYRNLVYKSWMYFEVEPFLEFNEKNDFKREVGIALSVISYYGQ